jgi:hypothetical protein
MALKNQLVLWSPPIGDVLFGSLQAGAIGASFGNGAATFGTNAQNPNQMGDDGNIAVNISAAGVSPSATALDKILAIMTIPANGFDLANRGVNIMAAGNCPNANSKSIKLIVNPTAPTLGATVSGGTTIASMLASTASGGWNLQANIFKYGAAGSNTQIAVHESGQIGATVSALVAPSLTTFPENATITVVVTGNSSTTNGDVVYNFGQIFGMN